MTYLPYAQSALHLNLQRLRDSRKQEKGMTIETVILIAVMASIAIAVGTVLIRAMTTKSQETEGQITA